MTDDVSSATVAGTSAQPPPGAGDLRPKLSVIIACLNGAATLGTQLEALAGQTCPVRWELLLADNGSTDASVAVAESFRPRIPGLRIIDASSHPGAGPARNFGVEQALGDWVAFCDADDEVAPDWLSAMAAALAQHPFVAGRFESHRLNGARVLRSRPLQQQDELQSSDIGARLPHAGGGNMGIHREDFLRVGGFDPTIRWLEDTDFSWRAQLAGVPLVFSSDVVVHVRLRQTFRSMYEQGRQYGLAQGLLEERYGRPTPTEPTPTEPTRTEPTAGGTSAAGSPRLRATVDSLIDHLIGGRLAWRVGWVVGHRSRRAGRSDAPVPSPPP
jgi:cellulose synthase/poly-beta-1,6-N-acetylglucosamine synthase-like glycosyltransferase